jgi:hypothetical protein
MTTTLHLNMFICSLLDNPSLLSPFQHFSSQGILKYQKSHLELWGPPPHQHGQSPWWPGLRESTCECCARWGSPRPSERWGAASTPRAPEIQRCAAGCFHSHREFCPDCLPLGVAVQIGRVENWSQYIRTRHHGDFALGSGKKRWVYRSFGGSKGI